MRLLGKEHYSFSLWCWLLQENLYIQGCKNSVLLPAFFFLKPKGPGEIICLWNFHFLHACLPGASPAVYLGHPSKPTGLPFSQICENPRKLENPAAWGLSADGPGEALMIHRCFLAPLFFPALSTASLENHPWGFVRSCVWGAGLTHCTCRWVLTSQWSAIRQTERAVCRVCIRQEEAQRQDQLWATAERMKRHIGGDVPEPGMGYEEDELTLWT